MAKRSNDFFSFYFKKKSHQNPHFSQLTEVRAPLTLSLSLQFLSAGPSACIHTHPKKKKEKNPQLPVCVLRLTSPYVFNDSPARVCSTTHQPVCILRLTSHPSKAFLHLPMAYGSRRVCFWSHWVGAAPRQTLLHEEARHRDLHRTAPSAYMVHNVSLGQFETTRNLQLQKMYWQLEHKSEPHKQDVHLDAFGMTICVQRRQLDMWKDLEMFSLFGGQELLSTEIC